MRETEVQALEDVICFAFLCWHFADFAADRAPEQLADILTKTAAKMSEAARARVLVEFPLPPDLALACM